MHTRSVQETTEWLQLFLPFLAQNSSRPAPVEVTLMVITLLHHPLVHPLHVCPGRMHMGAAAPRTQHVLCKYLRAKQCRDRLRNCRCLFGLWRVVAPAPALAVGLADESQCNMAGTGVVVMPVTVGK